MAKVIFLVTQSEMGGAQRYVYEIAKALSGKHKILVAAGEGDGELFEKLKNTQVQPVYLKQLRRTPNPIFIIETMVEILSILKKEKPDVLFLCSTTAGILGSIAARIYRGRTSAKMGTEVRPPKIRVIYRIGGWAFRDPRPFWKNWLILWAEKLTAHFKNLIIVNSEYDRRIAIAKHIVAPEKIVKIYNGINADSLDFISKEEARQKLITNYKLQITNYRLVGCVANFYKTKGLEYLIGAFARPGLRGRPGLKLLIIGEGRLRPQLEAQIKKLGLENKVILTGRIPDAYKYLKAFDIFVLPSLKEGFPWVILEAIAAGIPIIATKVGAMPEILPEEFLAEPGDSEALAKKISQMLEHPAYPELKQEFTLQKMVEATEEALRAN